MELSLEHKVQGNWKSIKKEIRHRWKDLSDEDLEESKGNLHRMADIIHDKYGDSRESIESKMEKFLIKYRPQ